MASEVIVRVRYQGGVVDLPGTLGAAGAGASRELEKRRETPGIHLLAVGDRSYAITLRPPVLEEALAALRGRKGKSVLLVFPGRTPVRRKLKEILVHEGAAVPDAPALDLTAGREGAAPLWLLPEGTFSTTPSSSPIGAGARDALVTAARWISSRRTSTFECLFPPSAFHPEEPLRTERL
ncbi:MAG: hypothetical protein IT372_10610, partial [Polyangiaceae bacterium]|nr:hypothetical protein [Polyangiaceae bacterium]